MDFKSLFFILGCFLLFAGGSDAKVCPDGSSCSGDETCCSMASGGYGCCPFPNAVCCSDKEHCCPSGHQCDTQHDRCTGVMNATVTALGQLQKSAKESFVPKRASFNKLMSLLKHEEPNIICPDHSKQCDKKTTCCKTEGGYGCCPLPNAVCCSDKLHCCPHGTVCDVATATCRHGEDTPTGVLITESGLQEIEHGDRDNSIREEIVCPGGGSSCPDGTTCCSLASGGYGCCPFPNAVCCSDHSHCCPSGATCDLVREKCVFPFHSIAWAEKRPAAIILASPLEESLATSGLKQVCPIPNAVSCPDAKHCCPDGMKCDVASGACYTASTKHVVEIPWISKVPSKNYDGTDGEVCPGGKAQCPSDNTCCKLKSGDWGCCPLPKAVCCADKEHCCPAGYTCLGSTGRCQKQL